MCDLPGCRTSDLPFHVLINTCHLTEVCLYVSVYTYAQCSLHEKLFILSSTILLFLFYK